MQTIPRSLIQTEAHTHCAGYTAHFNLPFPDGVEGCPLGRGETEELAMADLLERTNRESGLDLALIGARGSL